MNTVLQDLHHALRLMRRAPGLHARGARHAGTRDRREHGGLLRRGRCPVTPLPYAGADRIVRLSELHPGGTAIISDARLSNLTFDAWRERASTIESPAAYNSQAYTLGGVDEPARLDAASVSPSLFPLLSVTPAAGRFFRDEDIVPGASRVVVLSHALWQSRFGQDPSAIGRTMLLDGNVHEIVGIAPAWFYFPDRDAQLWTPCTYRRRSASGR